MDFQDTLCSKKRCEVVALTRVGQRQGDAVGRVCPHLCVKKSAGGRSQKQVETNRMRPLSRGWWRNQAEGRGKKKAARLRRLF